ncbi:S-adenosyl-L-methionine-dependent methyltransferase [Xylogone sp. PMI_703]|nr:S-adenosyl-L-methionine-dependent methyltransferase [Xylogone sp. PMI_703]
MTTQPPLTVPELYNARASTYDDKTTFHRHLASEYIKYANPQPGESLLDLACGTGLVTFEFAHILHPGANTSNDKQPTIIGVDISSGMLDVAREKLSGPKNADDVDVLKDKKSSFDIITICSALVLLPSPSAAIKHWTTYLKPGGRLIVDIPALKSMLALKVFGDLAPEFGVEVLGDRRWIRGTQSLKEVLEGAGLVNVEVTETDIWDDIPARTNVEGKLGKGVWTIDEGGLVFDKELERGNSFRKLGEQDLRRARERFVREWGKLAGDDGLVKEEGRLYIGVGRKPN